MKKLYLVLIAGLFLYSSASFATMDLETFKRLADKSSMARCDVTFDTCKFLLDTALERKLITEDAYNWGIKEGHYPNITFLGRVGAVCGCYCPYEGWRGL